MSPGLVWLVWVVLGAALFGCVGALLHILEKARVGTRAVQVLGAFVLVLGVLLFLAWKLR